MLIQEAAKKLEAGFDKLLKQKSARELISEPISFIKNLSDFNLNARL